MPYPCISGSVAEKEKYALIRGHGLVCTFVGAVLPTQYRAPDVGLESLIRVRVRRS
jgi:hypothetical protein